MRGHPTVKTDSDSVVKREGLTISTPSNVLAQIKYGALE